MHVVLLAAGLGSRLGPLTQDLPKALIEVGGVPLVIRALRFAARLSPERVVVVGGFGFDKVADELERRRQSDGPEARLPVELVENREFRAGNVLTLQAARPRLDDDFLVMNIDHVYRLSIAAIAAAPALDVTAFVDTDRALGADDMKVERDGEGRVRRISKTLERWDAGYVGMTRVPRSALGRYFAEVDAALAAEGNAIHVERVLGRLAEHGTPPLTRDISGHGWLEVDTPDERAAADAALAAGGWD